MIENRTGNVLALVGSEDYFAPAAGQVNGAWAPRSAGSTFKPFTYLLAFEQGASPATVVADVPAEFSTPTGIFRPVNYNHRCYGPMRYRLALANSLNVAAVKVLASVGGPAVLQERLRACGLTTLNQPPEFYGLGLTIGNAETRLLELANAYACLARLGEFKPYRLFSTSQPTDEFPEAAHSGVGTVRPHSITFPSVAHGDEPSPPLGSALGLESITRQIFDPAAAYLIADILGDNSARTLAFGADSELRFDFPVACKTGTSSDFRDNWAIGYTPEFTAGVWVGHFDGSPMEHLSGVAGAAPVLHDLFVHLHEHYGTSWYAPLETLVERFINPITGRLVADAKPGAILEKFISRDLPAPESPEDLDPAGRVRLSPEYRDWFATGDNWLAGRAVLESPPREPPSLSLICPLPGTTYYLDPDLPANSRRLSLKAQGGGALAWESDSLRCQSEADGTFAILTEGRHQLRVRNLLTGTLAETWILVKPL